MCLLPVVDGQLGVSSGVAGAGDAVVGAGLFVLSADLARQRERCVMLGAGLPGLPGGQGYLPQAIERVGFTGFVTDFPVYGHGLLQVAGCLIAAVRACRYWLRAGW